MRKFIPLILMIFFYGLANAQTINVESIKADTSCLYGIGTGFSIEEADEYALQDLISRISVNVSSRTSSTAEENTEGNIHTSNSRFSSTIETYSHASLSNTQKYVISQEPEAQVIRWIKKSDIKRMFEERKKNILGRIDDAVEAEKSGKIDIALMNYYWSLLLLNTLQYPGELAYLEEGDSIAHPLISYIPNKINNIFRDLDAKVVKREGSDLDLYITYKKSPVTSIDYTYWDGQNQSNIYSAKDGMGVLELPAGYEPKQINLTYEYRYYNERHIDPHITSVFKSRGIEKPPFTKAKATIPSGIQKITKTEKIAMEHSISTVQTNKNAAIAASKNLKEIDPVKKDAPPKTLEADGKYKKIIQELLSQIEKKDYNAADSLFTPDGADVFRQLLKYGKARIVGEPDYKFFKHGDEVIARGGQMSFSFSQGLRKSFVEDVVFTFNKDFKISNIAFGLGNEAVRDILNKGVWNDTARIAIMEFLENYKTAYALKRLDYIETIFDDDAVIITGKYVSKPQKKAPGEEISISARGNEIIEYNRMTKDQFLRHLKMCFNGKEFINIRFASNRVRRMGVGGELYAIEIAQDYYSSNYGDKGYLFLMVDINNPKAPIIKVRTWQPEKDPNFGLYGPGDFH